MKMQTYFREGMTITDKVTGTLLEVINVIREGKEVVAVKAAPVLGLDNAEAERVLDTENIITIDNRNGICFRTNYIPEGKMLVGYNVVDGILVDAKGEPVTEQGTIVVKEILAAMDRETFLLVTGRENGKDFLSTYQVDKDKFQAHIPLGDGVTVKMLSSNPKLVIFHVLQTTMVTEQEEKEDWEAVLHNKLYALAPGSVPVPLRGMSFIPTSSIVYDSDTLILKCEEEEDSETSELVKLEKPTYVPLLVEEGMVTAYVPFKDRPVAIQNGFVFTENAVTKGTSGVVVVQNKKALSAIIEKQAYFLVDRTEKGAVTYLTFANEKYETVTVKKEATRDRGEIISVVDSF